MKGIFLGKPLHWLLWVANLGVLVALGSQKLHTREFNLFTFIVLAVTAASILSIVLTYRKGDRITREPFDDD